MITTHPIFMKPRVCYILPEYDAAAGSHFFYLYELLERAQNSLELFVIVEKAGAGVKHFPFPAHVQKFRFLPLRAFELFFLVCRERMRGTKYFYTHYSFFGAVISWFVTAVSGGTVYYWNCGMPWLYRRSRIAEFVFRFILRHTVLVTGTEGIAKEYERRYNLIFGKIRILPNWINLQRWGVPEAPHRKEVRSRMKTKLGIADSQKVVLFVHHVSRRKGSHRVLPTAVSVTKSRSDVIFLVVGGGPEQQNLKTEIQNLGLGGHVRLLGEVPNKELPGYFAVADVFFMPSEEEGFPHVLLEAMAAGVPYVASDAGGVREITPPELQGYVISEDDTARFSQKIVQLLSITSEERGRIIHAEQEWVKQYDINVIVAKFIQLFS